MYFTVLMAIQGWKTGAQELVFGRWEGVLGTNEEGWREYLDNRREDGGSFVII